MGRVIPNRFSITAGHPALRVLGDGRQHQPAEGLRQVDELLVAFQGHPLVEGRQDAGHLAVADALQSDQGLQGIAYAVDRQLVEPGGDQKIIGGDQGGKVQQVGRGGAVQQDQVIGRAFEDIRQDIFSQGHTCQRLLQSGGALVGADHIQTLQTRWG